MWCHSKKDLSSLPSPFLVPTSSQPGNCTSCSHSQMRTKCQPSLGRTRQNLFALCKGGHVGAKHMLPSAHHLDTRIKKQMKEDKENVPGTKAVILDSFRDGNRKYGCPRQKREGRVHVFNSTAMSRCDLVQGVKAQQAVSSRDLVQGVKAQQAVSSRDLVQGVKAQQAVSSRDLVQGVKAPQSVSLCDLEEGVKAPQSVKRRRNSARLDSSRETLVSSVNTGGFKSTVLQCRHLRSQVDTLCNAYIHVSMQCSDNTRKLVDTSGICLQNNNPIFNHSFRVPTEMLDHDKKRRLLISVYHYNQNARHDELLGCMSFGVEHLMTRSMLLQKSEKSWYYLLRESLGLRKHLLVHKKKQQSSLRGLSQSRLPTVNANVTGMQSLTVVVYRQGEGYGFSLRAHSCPVQVGRVKAPSAALQAGLRTGDYITKVRGHNVSRSSARSITLLISRSLEPLELEVYRPLQSTMSMCSSWVESRSSVHQCSLPDTDSTKPSPKSNHPLYPSPASTQHTHHTQSRGQILHNSQTQPSNSLVSSWVEHTDVQAETWTVLENSPLKPNQSMTHGSLTSPLSCTKDQSCNDFVSSSPDVGLLSKKWSKLDGSEVAHNLPSANKSQVFKRFPSLNILPAESPSESAVSSTFASSRLEEDSISNPKVMDLSLKEQKDRVASPKALVVVTERQDGDGASVSPHHSSSGLPDSDWHLYLEQDSDNASSSTNQQFSTLSSSCTQVSSLLGCQEKSSPFTRPQYSISMDFFHGPDDTMYPTPKRRLSFSGASTALVADSVTDDSLLEFTMNDSVLEETTLLTSITEDSEDAMEHQSDMDSCWTTQSLTRGPTLCLSPYDSITPQQEAGSTQHLRAMEVSFSTAMSCGIQKYSRPLRHSILSQYQHQVLFRNIEKIAALSKFLLNQDKSTSSPTDCLTSVYLPNLQVIAEAYSHYFEGITKAKLMLKDLHTCSQFTEFLQKAGTTADRNQKHISIEQFLERPIQHLKALSQHLQSSHFTPSNQQLSKIVLFLEQILSKLEEQKRPLTQQTLGKDNTPPQNIWQTSMCPEPHELSGVVETARTVVLQDVLRLEDKGLNDLVSVWLLDTALVIHSQAGTAEGTDLLKTVRHHVIPLVDIITVTLSTATEPVFRMTFRERAVACGSSSQHQTRTLDFRAATHQMAVRWSQTLEYHVDVSKTLVL